MGYATGDTVGQRLRLGEHARWGETVTALVVLADEATTTDRKLIHYCKSKLTDHEPRQRYASRGDSHVS